MNTQRHEQPENIIPPAAKSGAGKKTLNDNNIHQDDGVTAHITKRVLFGFRNEHCKTDNLLTLSLPIR